MNLIQLIACIGLITGCFVLLHISPMDFTEGVFRRITSKPKSIRSEVNESTRRKKKSFLRREIEETQTILRMTGRAAKFPMVCALSLLLFLVGAAFALTLGNLFLVPVLAVGMMFVPFWFIQRRKVKDFFIKFKKKLHFADFLTEQTLDFVLHRLFCGLAEMDTDDIGCLADLLSDSRASGGVSCGIVHSKSSCK